MIAEGATPQEIQIVLELTDRLGVHREQVRIPLLKRDLGVVRLPDGRIEITLARGVDARAQLGELESRLNALLADF